MIPRYRAWINTEKRMIKTGDLLDIDYENEVVTTQRVYFYFENGLPDGRDLDNFVFEEIKLMQSTGLRDKNGKEVFVGDIIKCTRGCLHEVYIEKEYGGTYFGGMPAVYLKGLREGYAWTEHEEIIGNIYENPELFGG